MEQIQEAPDLFVIARNKVTKQSLSRGRVSVRGDLIDIPRIRSGRLRRIAALRSQ